MIEDWIVVTGGVVVIIVIMTATLLKLRSAERRMYESSHKLKVYTDLLNAITELNLASGDLYKMDNTQPLESRGKFRCT
jgi:cytochrome c-type biogenesis protein CcmH/NrfG